MLDPREPATVYAGFYYSINGMAPPENLVGMYSLDSGVTWHTVPAPPGLNIDDFEGFTSDSQGIVAMFAKPYSDNDGIDAHVTIRAQVTNDSGLTWSPSTLNCPTTGPCITFGTFVWGNCAMDGMSQPLLIGAHSTPSPTNVKWSMSSWVTLVDTCFSQELVATSQHDVLLLDPSSPNSLLRSTNGGETWVNIDLPTIADSTLGSDDPSDANSLLLDPNGTLFASLTNRAGSEQELYQLAPGATTWCEVPRVFGTFASAGSPGPLRTSGNDVAWMQTVYNNSNTNLRTTLHVRSVSSLHC
jgi:hypothetical protein